MSKDLLARCSRCNIPVNERSCLRPKGKGMGGCPTLTKTDLINEALLEYDRPEIAQFAREASIQESSCYHEREKSPYVMHPIKPRIQEICEFAVRMGYLRLGLVYCAGLAIEGNMVDRILDAQGFEIVSVWCKAGSIPKERIGLKEEDKVYIDQYEPMCNPILQAKIVNDAKTHFNILLGLCVGHDSLFFKYADAPTTVLAVKDRVLGHNPLGALYTKGSYYERLLRKGF
ncbi:MAG: DUF1847 domain-containing protein [Syntrophales bacterium]|jgi:uncharacterized metal-binding protein|nr:DUF1847 domain-containing protein [Syntrophales bacterium]MDY0045636.1 DUF1847 domain-containing protein [Syntrophales bacterium]